MPYLSISPPPAVQHPRAARCRLPVTRSLNRDQSSTGLAGTSRRRCRAAAGKTPRHPAATAAGTSAATTLLLQPRATRTSVQRRSRIVDSFPHPRCPAPLFLLLLPLRRAGPQATPALVSSLGATGTDPAGRNHFPHPVRWRKRRPVRGPCVPAAFSSAGRRSCPASHLLLSGALLVLSCSRRPAAARPTTSAPRTRRALLFRADPFRARQPALTCPPRATCRPPEPPFSVVLPRLRRQQGPPSPTTPATVGGALRVLTYSARGFRRSTGQIGLADPRSMWPTSSTLIDSARRAEGRPP